ncbi:hypothetical protein AN1V17_30170 [Vallitalea sediminicola]|jgi:hypothetical protein|nr:hypothetical protein [Maledivibacter sp.]
MTRLPTGRALKAMENIDVSTVNKQELVDIRDVHIEKHQSKEEKIKSFIDQVKNPYCYKCGNVVVKVSYDKNKVTMQEKMKHYLSDL